MASNSIELKLISCKDLRAFNFFQKLCVYATVALGTGDREKGKRKQLQKTPVDRDGGGNPEWNHEARFDLDEIPSGDADSLFLEFDLLCDGIFTDKTVGEVRVPVSDLIGEYNGVPRFVNYQVRSTEGKPNGVLHFSYKVNFKGEMAFANLPFVYPTPSEFMAEGSGEQAPVMTAADYIYPPPPPVHLAFTYCPPPPVMPMYCAAPAPEIYPPPIHSVFCGGVPDWKPVEGYCYSFPGYPSTEQPELDEPWRRYGYPTLQQSEPFMPHRGVSLYPTIG